MNLRCWINNEQREMLTKLCNRLGIFHKQYGRDNCVNYAYYTPSVGINDAILGFHYNEKVKLDSSFVSIDKILEALTKSEITKSSELIEYGEKKPLSQITGFFIWNGEIYLKGKYFCFDKEDTTPFILPAELVTPIKVKL